MELSYLVVPFIFYIFVDMVEYIKIKPLSYYNEVKRKFNRNKVCNAIQWRYITRPAIGCCSTLYEKLAPTSIQDFADKYVESADNNFNRITLSGRRDCGRSVADLKYLASRLCLECNQSDITEEMCFDNLIAHILVETLCGKMVEDYVKKKMEESGENVATIEADDMDANFNVDITVRSKKSGKLVKYLQIKPITTFLGNYGNPKLMSDRRNFFIKQINYNNFLFENNRRNEISSIKYMCYRISDNGYEFLTKDGKTEFELSDLINENGTTKIPSYNDCVFTTI